MLGIVVVYSFHIKLYKMYIGINLKLNTYVVLMELIIYIYDKVYYNTM